jgi:hypothetical protein
MDLLAISVQIGSLGLLAYLVTVTGPAVLYRLTAWVDTRDQLWTLQIEKLEKAAEDRNRLLVSELVQIRNVLEELLRDARRKPGG